MTPWSDTIQQVQEDATNVWLGALANDGLREFARHTRDGFLLRVIENRFPDAYIAAGMGNHDVTMQSDENKKHKPGHPGPTTASGSDLKDSSDPWVAWDPWKPKPPRPAQSRREDLQLQTPLPFFGSDNKPLTQTHRLQITPTRGGVVFTTKSNLPEVMKSSVNGDLVAIIPAGDHNLLKHISDRLEGPRNQC